MESVRRMRREKGLSQQELANLARVGQDSISAIETGKHEPHPRTLRKLAEALDVEVADFFREPALAEKAEAPREAGQPEEARTVRGIARAAARRKFETDLQAANRTLAAEGIPQPPRISDVYDPATYAALSEQPPGELAGALLDSERDNLQLEHENSDRAIQLDYVRRDRELLKQEIVELKQEIAELKAETEHERSHS